MQTIAIIGGTGPEGRGLALRFARAGASVRIGSRSLDRARQTAGQVAAAAGGGAVEGFENAAALAGAQVAILTVPADAQVDTLESVRANFQAGTVLIDSTVRLKSVENSALIAAQHVPEGVSVASAFHTLGADLLEHVEEPLDSDVLVCADAPEARDQAVALVRMLPGARAVDAGPLKNSRLVENTVQLLIAINRRNKVKHAGVRITGL
jgi:NADPH-dependent F420 reductase